MWLDKDAENAIKNFKPVTSVKTVGRMRSPAQAKALK